MKISKEDLGQIIKEELKVVLEEKFDKLFTKPRENIRIYDIKGEEKPEDEPAQARRVGPEAVQKTAAKLKKMHKEHPDAEAKAMKINYNDFAKKIELGLMDLTDFQIKLDKARNKK